MDKDLNKTPWLSLMTLFAVFLALLVVMLGAYTRLTNAGLGCPDWPGCYGKLMLPQAELGLQKAQEAFPQVPLEPLKAWTEMVHRYAAGCLALLIFFIAGTVLIQRRQGKQLPWLVPLLLLFLVLFQALLGMWTVTLKLLPIVVMGHLLGGILIFTLLSYFYWQISPFLGQELPQWRPYIFLGLLIVFMQIALGGWVSSNYAGIACVGFPTCNGVWFPKFHFAEAFHVSLDYGLNYQGGLMSQPGRMTAQMIHRLGAVITLVYILILSAFILYQSSAKYLRSAAGLLILLVLLQFILGIINVTYWLPLPIAVAHNGVAALLLATLSSLLHFSRRPNHVD